MEGRGLNPYIYNLESKMLTLKEKRLENGFVSFPLKMLTLMPPHPKKIPLKNAENISSENDPIL